MDAQRIIKELIKESGVTQTSLAKLVGIKTQGIVSQMLSINMGMKVGSFYKFTDALGYEVIVRKKKRGKLEEGYRRLSIEEVKED